jgi:Cu/Ag efflux protein CusF
MKTNSLQHWTVAVLAVLAMSVVLASADEPAAAVEKPKNYTGMIEAVNASERSVTVQGTVFSKQFNLGDTCAYAFVNQNNGSMNDLRPGQKITVSYQDVRGVLVADRIEQEPMRFEGVVKAVNAEKRTLMLNRRALDKEFMIAEGCKVMLLDDKVGALTDVQIGQHVTVLFETPKDVPTAREIVQTSEHYTGEITAIDLNERTVKAKTMFGSKRFTLADDCVIVRNGTTDGQIRDLNLGDKLAFSYDQVNGVNVVNRIAPSDEPMEGATAQGGSD